MDRNKLFQILQLCDSAFPVGGFSHSMGTEAAVQHFYVEDQESLKNFILCSLENAGSFCIPFVRAAHDAFGDVKKIETLDSLHNACLLNHVAYRASKQQGKSFLSTSIDVFHLSELEILRELAEKQKMHCHLPIIFAVVCSTLNIAAMETCQMYLFNSLRTIIASIVRLGKIGTVQAQKFQYEIGKHLDDILLRNWQTLPEEACIRFPLIEVLQNVHDTLFSKLFFS